MATASHRVAATLIVAKTDSGETYLRKGAVLPAGVGAAERKRLVGLGLVEQVKVLTAAEQKAAAEAAEKAIADAAAAEAERVKQAADAKSAAGGS
jgi:membrane protein involved in colicin uptake